MFKPIGYLKITLSFLVIIILPNLLLGQCTYDINGPSSTSIFVNAGETVCLHAGAVFTGSVTLNGGTLTNDATAPQAFTLTTINGSTGNVIVNNQTMAYSGSMSFFNTLTITNNGTFSTGSNFSFSADVSYINNGSTIVGGRLLNQGNLTNTGNHHCYRFAESLFGF